MKKKKKKTEYFLIVFRKFPPSGFIEEVRKVYTSSVMLDSRKYSGLCVGSIEKRADTIEILSHSSDSRAGRLLWSGVQLFLEVTAKGMTGRHRYGNFWN
jgi:hypothetical protein